jgi:hypothetical protein
MEMTSVDEDGQQETSRIVVEVITGDVNRQTEHTKTGNKNIGTANSCRGCKETLQSRDARSHWCHSLGCQKLKKEKHNERRRDKRKLHAVTNLPRIVKTLPECNYNSQFSFANKRDEMMSSGAIVLRGFLSEMETGVLFWHSSSLMHISEKNGSTKTISGNYTEIDVDTTDTTMVDGPLPKVLDKVTGLAKACAKSLFNQDQEIGLMYINKNASCTHQQLLHADSLFQSFVKVLVCLTKSAEPTRYVPYDRLFGEPIRKPSDATRLKIASRFQEMLPVGPGMSVDRLYKQTLPVTSSNLEMGDAVVFLGDFIHGGPGNKNTQDRRMLFVNTWSNSGENISRNNPLDRQVNIYTLMEILYENEDGTERRKRTIEALSRHLYSNGSDSSQIKYHARNLGNGNQKRFQADLRLLNTEIKKISGGTNDRLVPDDLLF